MKSIKVENTPGYNYWLFLPEGYGKEQQVEWPTILFLHGAGERGDNLNLVRKYGPPKIAGEFENFPFIVIAPQCPKGKIWADNLLVDLLDTALSRYKIDENRIYATGVSMGGAGVWNLAIRHPDRFAAIAPICGYGDPSQVLPLLKVPVWVFHGAKDIVIPVLESERMVKALKNYGGRVQLTIYSESGHAEAWEIAYRDWSTYEWLLQHKRHNTL
ncbi:MAG: prolyl oligopeptidase family serine peptidase [bacterium]